jgi:hypothetical protein
VGERHQHLGLRDGQRVGHGLEQLGPIKNDFFYKHAHRFLRK